MKKFIISILFVLLAGTFTAKAFAQTSVDVQVAGFGSCSAPAFTTLSSGNVTQFSGDCGDINFNSPNFDCDLSEGLGDCPTVTAQNNQLTQQLILNNTVITNNSSSPHIVIIQYTGVFPDIYTQEDNYYGLSASGNFFRPPFDLASGDSFTMTSTVTYANGVSNTMALQYPSNGQEGLPAFGSVSLNDFTPQDPAQVIQTFNCGGIGYCGAGETITTTLTVVLGPFDNISLLGSAHSPATGCHIIDKDNDLYDVNEATEVEDNGEGVDPNCHKPDQITHFVTTMSSLTASIDVKPGESENFVQPNSKGTLEVTLYGQKQTIAGIDVIFDVKNVDLTTVRFGPNCVTTLTPDEPGCHAKVVKSQFKDDNKDGVQDVRLSFNNQDVGWNPKCKPLQTRGTLVGKLNGTDFSASANVHCH
jgi:hypothetical protein